MTVTTDAPGLNLGAFLRAGDHIVWGQACGEPTTLVEALIARAHVSQIAPMIEQGLIGCDVALVQVSPPDADGNHSFGLINDFIQTAVHKARVVRSGAPSGRAAEAGGIVAGALSLLLRERPRRTGLEEPVGVYTDPADTSPQS
jgi:hypothetical protein